MDGHDHSSDSPADQVTGFSGGGRAAQVARLLVLDMVLWPGLLFAGATLLLAWQARGSLPALIAVALATLVSVLVGVRQWDVMLRAVFSPTAEPRPGAASPRPTGRGETEDRELRTED